MYVQPTKHDKTYVTHVKNVHECMYNQYIKVFNIKKQCIKTFIQVN